MGETAGLLPHVQRMGQGIWRILVQREHHKEQTFEQEYKEMINRSGLEWNDYRLT